MQFAGLVFTERKAAEVLLRKGKGQSSFRKKTDKARELLRSLLNASGWMKQSLKVMVSIAQNSFIQLMHAAVKCADHVVRSRFLNDVKIILSFRCLCIHIIFLKGPAAGPR